MNTPVEHVVDVAPDKLFAIEGDGAGYVSLILTDEDSGAVVSAYLNRTEVNALIGALQNAVTFEWEG